MDLITLKDVGKIYVSGGNVAVGIRGVNLSFGRGEFVAVTGESGSGKSTLLNIISGMDSYEEGEMLVEGEPTSHFVQQDWEEYRKKYISFIFQDYNIIESFTVLENVELALMHIEDAKERRERALDLLRRVGLEKHINHKGSKLSGGQKQRTVIARALAKDSPVILADEPTGNLDSQTSKEIIELLREVSKGKLVIVVTHNFEQVEACATRHIRVFDGAIESDHVISTPDSQPERTVKEPEKPEKSAGKTKTTLRNGLRLGFVRFRATPKLSVFLCVLMIISSVGMTLVTSLSRDALGLFDKDYIFTHHTGRVVLIRQDGAIITDAELLSLAEKTGAKGRMHYDFLLDRTAPIVLDDKSWTFAFSYSEVKPDIGRAPEKENEVVLRVPVSLRPYLGRDTLKLTELENVFGTVGYDIVGVDYFYDNTKPCEMVFTEKGYETAAALYYFSSNIDFFGFAAEFSDSSAPPQTVKVSSGGRSVLVSFDIGDGTYFNNGKEYRETLKALDALGSYTVGSSLTGTYTYNENSALYGSSASVEYSLGGFAQTDSVSEAVLKYMTENGKDVAVSPDIIVGFMTEYYYSKAYTQASLFYENDAQANSKAKEMKALGYFAVPSDAVDNGDGSEALLEALSLMWTAFVWVIAVLFITLFISLCSTRAMHATRGDIAILRSMGISTPVIKVSIYVQTLAALIPAYIVTAATAIYIFTSEKANELFNFLHAWEYAWIAIAMLITGVLLSKRYVKKMFESSVKKTLKGGQGND